MEQADGGLLQMRQEPSPTGVPLQQLHLSVQQVVREGSSGGDGSPAGNVDVGVGGWILGGQLDGLGVRIEVQRLGEAEQGQVIAEGPEFGMDVNGGHLPALCAAAAREAQAARQDGQLVGWGSVGENIYLMDPF